MGLWKKTLILLLAIATPQLSSAHVRDDSSPQKVRLIAPCGL